MGSSWWEFSTLSRIPQLYILEPLRKLSGPLHIRLVDPHGKDISFLLILAPEKPCQPGTLLPLDKIRYPVLQKKLLQLFLAFLTVHSAKGNLSVKCLIIKNH